jgi:hypothetical protein
MGIRELLNSAALVAALVVVPECPARAPSRQQPVGLLNWGMATSFFSI